jgi:molybdopterin molybdotransferase
VARGFMELRPVAEVLGLFERFSPPDRTERLPLTEAVGRVTAEDLRADEPVPAFARALMDGYAVRAREVAAARETSPQVLALAGEVRMGRPPPGPLAPGQAMAIPTGGMLPDGADAVVMIEHTRSLGPAAVEICRAVASGEHVLQPGQDVPGGALLLSAGHALAPVDLGALLAAGLTRVRVHARPRVAVLSTGDELVDPGTPPGPAQVRDTNACTLEAQVRAWGGEPEVLPRAGDVVAELLEAARAGLSRADALLLSGGSSVGARDHTAQVLAALGPPGLLSSGVALAPGKPTLVADAGGRPALGLPGHPVSSFVVFQVLVGPLLDRLSGRARPRLRPRVRGRLTMNLPGAAGRDTYVRARLEEGPEGTRVVPVRGDSAVFASLLRCDGLVCIPAAHEGLAEGDEVELELLR